MKINIPKLLAAILVFLSGSVIAYASLEFPDWGADASPASTHLSPHYIEKSMEETSVPNIVTAVLADYRGFDTMFETTVVFAAGLACFLLLRVLTAAPGTTRFFRHTPTGVVVEVREGGPEKLPKDVFEPIDSDWVPDDLINKTVCRIMIPFLQLFGLYVVAHGHHSPGGGFQGGVILGAALILLALSRDLRFTKNRLQESTNGLLSAIGVFIYAGVGAVSFLTGFNFLDYGGLAGILNTDPIAARSLGILFVEIGVAMAVMATMVLIYKNIASGGRMEEGL